MTLDSTISRVQYTQAGSTTEWPVTYKFLDNEDLVVITTVDDVDTTLVLDTDYSVTGAGDDEGGTVTISPAVALGTLVTIYRVVDLDQPTQLTTAGGWYPQVHEAVFDRLAMQIQQVQEQVDRAVKTGITSTETPDNIIADLYAARDAASASASDASGFADAAVASASDASGFADIAQGHADTSAGYVTDAEGFADDAEQSALDAVAAINSAAFTNLPIGTLVWHTGTTAFPGSIIADGELRSRAAFPDLWAFAQTSGNISVDDASWTFGQYSPGDGATTFRVPKVDDRFIRGKSATRPVGLVEEDAFQGHWHEFSRGSANWRTTGTSWNDPAASGTDATSVDQIRDAVSDGVNGTPRTADETRPKALTMLPCIKV